MRGSDMEITGSYSRLTPRYPISLPCALVHFIPRRWPKKQEELLVHAEIVEVSLAGLAIAIPSIADPDQYKLRSKVTFRVDGLDGRMAIRHIHATSEVLRLGGEFERPSTELEKYIQATVTRLEG